MGIHPIILVFCGIFAVTRGLPQLLFANRKDIRLVSFNANGKSNVSVLIGNLDDAAAVDFMYADGYIFWTDINLEKIKRASIGDASQASDGIITTGLLSPDGLSCDWMGKKLYWTDAETNRIEVSNLDGSYRRVLYWQNLDQPRAIALDPYSGFMFWTDWGEIPKIERAGMDGTLSTRSVIVNDDIYWPNGLTLDYIEKKVYWADAKLSFIYSCNFDGRQRRVVIDKGLPHPFALTLFGERLYWTDWQTKAIHSCDKNSGEDLKMILDDIHSPMDIHVFDADRQIQGNNSCGTDNGGCSHLCLMSPNPPNYKCACPTGVKLQQDEKTCADGSEEMLLLARRTDLRKISLDTPDFTDIELQIAHIKHAIAVDYDPLDGYVYWTDDQVRTIRRALLNGSNEEVLIKTEVDQPDGIAVDWIGRNLYWTDTGTDRIEVARLNGTSRKVLISEGLDEPRALWLDPEHGYMWWTDWGKEPKIERANLDGAERKVIINNDLVWPNGIAVDYADDKIYWCDAKRDKIEVANMDGTGRRVLVKDDLPHLFGFSLLGDYLYWTDWQRRSIERVNKRTGGNRTLIIDQLPDLMGLKAVSVKKVKGSNPCAVNNGGCSHLCLYTPHGAQCSCPMGLELISQSTKCIVPEAFLLFTDESDIKRMSLLVTHRVVPIPLRGIQEAMAIDFDISDRRIYWTDGGHKSISRAFMNGSAVEQIIEFGVDGPEGMAVDWVARNIYWVDSSSKRIEVAHLDGSARRVLVWQKLRHPVGLVLDPPNGYMYWTDWSDPPKLERAYLDGSNREELVPDVGRIHGLTIDYTRGRLYWADMDNNKIESCFLNGTDRQVVVNKDIPNPMALTQYQDSLFWTDWDDKRIEKVNKTTGGNRTIVYEDKVMDLLVFHHSRQSGWNKCHSHNCSHLCFALPPSVSMTTNQTHVCACPTHYTLNPADGKTCTPPRSFLLFSQKNSINRLAEEGGETGASPDIVLPIKMLRNLRALDYDPVKEYIYWISGRSKSIKKSKADGSQTSVVVNNAGIRPFDLAIDPYSHLMFWSCSNNNVVNFTRIDTKVQGTVVDNTANQKPRYLAINPIKGHLYWTNIASAATIQRSLYDGTESISLFPTGLTKPGPITVDTTSNMLFWADAEERTIECSDLSGGNRKTLLGGKQNDQVGAILGLAVLGNYLYWVDKDKQFIGKFPKKTGGKNLTFVQHHVINLSDIHSVVYLDEADVAKNLCSKDNGGCSHICIPKKNKKVQCSCPSNLVLKKDDRSCVERTTCAPQEFTCKSGNKECIPRSWLCDGRAECNDNSDEEDCPICEKTEFQCRDGACVREEEVCDGVEQCMDRSDEEACCENVQQIKCSKSNKCYDRNRKCDGKFDCPDESDEKNCQDASVGGRDFFVVPTFAIPQHEHTSTVGELISVESTTAVTEVTSTVNNVTTALQEITTGLGESLSTVGGFTPEISELTEGVTDTQLFIIKFFSIYGAVLGSIGNILTIAAILKGRLHHQGSFLKILNLSVCNLIHCVIFLPLLTVQAFTGLWTNNALFCNLYSFGLLSNMGTEILGCVCITLNRYFCVVHHRAYRWLYNSRAKLAAQWLITWAIYPAILAFPLFNLGSHYQYVPAKLICHPFGTQCGWYCYLLFVPSLITFPTIGYCYMKIIYVYFKVQRKVGLSRDSPSDSSHTSESSLYRVPDHRNRAEIKMTFTILAVVFVFGVFRTPFMVLYIYDPSMTKIDPLIHTILIYSGINANWINPLIYAYTNKQIRKSLKSLWCS